VPYEKPAGFTQMGSASWYGEAFHGRRTANGEIYDRHAISAAHPTMPLPAYARVTNTLNSRSIIVRVNDRGPYHGGRVMDVSQRTAEALAFRHLGTARVKIEYLGRASLRGSDDSRLFATLRTDGSPAALPGSAAIMVASAEPAMPRAAAAAAARTADLDATGSTEMPRAEPVQAYAPPAPAPVAAPLPAPQPTVTLAPLQGGTPMPGAPRPPERPFDLATIPHAATPVASAVPGARPAMAAGGQRPVVASLFYASPAQPSTRFVKGDPFRDLRADRFAPLDLRATR
jgi:rare lipoprotein A